MSLNVTVAAVEECARYSYPTVPGVGNETVYFLNIHFQWKLKGKNQFVSRETVI